MRAGLRATVTGGKPRRENEREQQQTVRGERSLSFLFYDELMFSSHDQFAAVMITARLCWPAVFARGRSDPSVSVSLSARAFFSFEIDILASP